MWPVRPTRGVNRGYQTGILRDDGTLREFHRRRARRPSTAAIACRRSSTATCSSRSPPPISSAASSSTTTGRRCGARKAYERGEFIASTDERFRPVYLSSAPDGTLYVVDMYRGIIQHRGFITEYLRDQILSRHLEQPIGRRPHLPRRARHDASATSAPALSTGDAAALVEVLSHPNGWWRDTAQHLLVQRHDVSAVEPLRKLAGGSRRREPGCTRCGRWTAWTARARATSRARSATRRATCGVGRLRLSERVAARRRRDDDGGGGALAADRDWAVRDQLGRFARRAADGAKETAARGVPRAQRDAIRSRWTRRSAG